MGADVVVVGGGLVGLGAAWALSRRGKRVVVLEAFEPGHAKGSSHGSARIFRRAYPDELYVRLTGEAGKLWRELEEEAGEELISVTGAIDFGVSPVPRIMYDLLTEQHIPAELLTARQARERWPQFVFTEQEQILYHPEGGVIDSDRAMAAMARLAAERGADIRYGVQVTGIDQDGTVRTEHEILQADRVIVAAGAWTGPLLGDHVKLPLTVTQKEAFHYRPVAGTNKQNWPTFIHTASDGVTFYGLPSGPDVPGAIKVGVHNMGTVTTGDDRDFRTDPRVRSRARRFVMESIPGLDPEPVTEVSCLYTSTPSEDFIIDRRGSIVVVSACSGHGAKFAPLTGELAADLADGKPPKQRFAIK
jgi:monomeric sarcosine oxidase